MMLGRLWIRIKHRLGRCTLGESYFFPNEHPELGDVLLAECVVCGALHRLT